MIEPKHELQVKKLEASLKKLRPEEARNNPKWASSVSKSLYEKYMDELLEIGVPPRARDKHWRFFAKFVPRWLKGKPETIGDGRFTVHQDVPAINDALISLEIQDSTHPRKMPVARLGGFVYYEKEKPAVRITNIQGHFFGRTKTEPAVYAYLKKALGESWRVFFMRKLVEAAKAGKFAVIGELPERKYIELHIEREAAEPEEEVREHARLLRQYRQTYRKAGLREHPDGTWRLEEPVITKEA